MTEKEFIEKRDEVIEKIRSSSLYQEFKKIDAELYTDKDVCFLTSKKDKLIQEYKFLSEDKKDEALKEIMKIQKSIDELPIVKKYYELKKQLKDLVKPIEKDIIGKLYL